MTPSARHHPYLPLLSAIVLIALAARLAVRLRFGESDFWANSYSDYYSLAENFVAGKGLCFDSTCAWFPPLYPLFLACAALAGKHYLLIVIPQSLLGAATALLAFPIGRAIFNPLTGIVASLITALYPYYVMHDTALQETALLTFGMALSVSLLLRAQRTGTTLSWLLAGISLAAVVLTRASLAPTVVLALCWACFINWRKALWATLALAAAVSPWLIRTWRLAGAPVLTSQTGRALWIGNNPETFARYPSESIDRSTDLASDALTPAERADLDRHSQTEITESDWYKHRALVYIQSHPSLTVRNACRKLAAAFSWTLNPNREKPAQLAYAASYGPLSILALIGAYQARTRFRECSLIYLLFAAFVGVTAVFWAHTSHRAYLDLYIIVFASSVIARYTPKRLSVGAAA